MALQAWANEHAADESIAASIYTSSLQADLGGQMFVRLVEVPESVSEKTLALDDRPRPSFLALPFDEAIAAFLQRGLITPDEFRRLSTDARARAFTATRLATDALRQRAYEGLLSALRDGSTLRDFAAGLRTEELSLGVTPADSYYVENVFRTNVGASYSAGRYRQVRSDAVMAARPFVQYVNPLDSRTSSICRALAGKIFAQDDPAWPRIAPLNHFMCRSSVITRRADQVSESQVTSAAALPLEAQPAPGFDAPPAL